MIAAFSTSSAQASVALFDEDGRRICSSETEASRAASGACIAMLEECLAELGCSLAEVSLFLADLGPGSFTGTRVGVTLAKTLAFAVDAKAGGADAFDLIAPDSTVVLPSKRNEWFVRTPGKDPIRTGQLPTGEFVGYGFPDDAESQRYPHAANFFSILVRVSPMEPEQLQPRYLIEPSISLPKRPFGQVGHAG